MDDVVWTRRARRNLEEIADYIGQDNPQAAERLVRRIVEQASGLAYYPRIGRLGSVQDTRELPIANTSYIVVYRTTDRVEVLRIRHAAQRWPS